MSLLYQYLTSLEFKLQIEGIAEGFTQMQCDLIKEKLTKKDLETKGKAAGKSS